jgi:hypothetical protein
MEFVIWQRSVMSGSEAIGQNENSKLDYRRIMVTITL